MVWLIIIALILFLVFVCLQIKRKIMKGGEFVAFHSMVKNNSIILSPSQFVLLEQVMNIMCFNDILTKSIQQLTEKRVFKFGDTVYASKHYSDKMLSDANLDLCGIVFNNGNKLKSDIKLGYAVCEWKDDGSGAGSNVYSIYTYRKSSSSSSPLSPSSPLTPGLKRLPPTTPIPEAMEPLDLEGGDEYKQYVNIKENVIQLSLDKPPMLDPLHVHVFLEFCFNNFGEQNHLTRLNAFRNIHNATKEILDYIVDNARRKSVYIIRILVKRDGSLFNNIETIKDSIRKLWRYKIDDKEIHIFNGASYEYIQPLINSKIDSVIGDKSFESKHKSTKTLVDQIKSIANVPIDNDYLRALLRKDPSINNKESAITALNSLFNNDPRIAERTVLYQQCISRLSDEFGASNIAFNNIIVPETTNTFAYDEYILLKKRDMNISIQVEHSEGMDRHKSNLIEFIARMFMMKDTYVNVNKINPLRDLINTFNYTLRDHKLDPTSLLIQHFGVYAKRLLGKDIFVQHPR